jgi:hypothetical protein
VKEYTGQLLAKATEAIEAAELLVTNNYPAHMINQAREFLEAARTYLG